MCLFIWFLVSDRCYLPRSVGRCHGTSYRYYYNADTERCEEFVYGGCLGNDNKFNTADECEKVCVKPHNAGMFMLDTVCIELLYFITLYRAACLSVCLSV